MQQDKIMMLEKAISEHYQNMTGLVVLKDGDNVYENYYHGYTAENPIHIASVTKSILSALIGIAIEKGYLKSVDQKVLEFFPKYETMKDETTIQNVTIRNLLTMTAPYKYESEPYAEVLAGDDWIKAALDLLGGKAPIGTFNYSAFVGTHILSGILVQATGQSVLDFASENLFSPLAIYIEQNIKLPSQEAYFAFLRDRHTSGWVVDPQGIHTAGWGLTLTPRDMSKIGQLYLDGGKWQEKQLIPKQWIDTSTKEHSRWGHLSYGYLWWVIDNQMHSYAALGDGGNAIYVNTKKRLVVSITSLFMPETKDRIEWIKKFIEPVFG